MKVVWGGGGWKRAIFSCFYCSIDLKKQSVHSGLRPDTSGLFLCSLLSSLSILDPSSCHSPKIGLLVVKKIVHMNKQKLVNWILCLLKSANWRDRKKLTLMRFSNADEDILSSSTPGWQVMADNTLNKTP